MKAKDGASIAKDRQLKRLNKEVADQIMSYVKT